MAIEHPAERGGRGRGRFEHVAEAASNLASSPAFFAGCSILVAAWALSFALGWSDGLRSFLGDMLTAVTLALVALVRNAEQRSEHAIQLKLDAVARAMLEQAPAGRASADLERAIGHHEDV